MHLIHNGQASQYLPDCRLAQRYTFCLEQEPDLENMVSSTPVQRPGTLVFQNFDITYTSAFRKQLFDRAYHWLLLALLDVSYSGTQQIQCWLIDSFNDHS